MEFDASVETGTATAPPTSDPLLTPQDFAAKIKEKYPVYKDVDDIELTKRIVEKYPVYADKVKFDEPPTTEQPAPAMQSNRADDPYTMGQMSPDGDAAAPGGAGANNVTLAPNTPVYGKKIDEVVAAERPIYSVQATDANASQRASMPNPNKTKFDRMLSITKDNFMNDPLFSTSLNKDENKEIYFKSLEKTGIDVDRLRNEMAAFEVAGDVAQVAAAPITSGYSNIAMGADKVMKTDETYQRYIKEGDSTPIATLKTILSAIAGTTTAALGLANVVPFVAAFTSAIKTMEVTDNEEYLKLIQPVTAIVEEGFKKAGKPVPEWVYDASLMGDLVAGGAMFHYGGKYGMKAIEAGKSKLQPQMIVDWTAPKPPDGPSGGTPIMETIIEPLKDPVTAQAIAVTKGDPDLVPLVEQQIRIEQDLPTVENKSVQAELQKQHDDLSQKIETVVNNKIEAPIIEGKNQAEIASIKKEMQDKSPEVQLEYQKRIQELENATLPGEEGGTKSTKDVKENNQKGRQEGLLSGSEKTAETGNSISAVTQENLITLADIYNSISKKERKQNPTRANALRGKIMEYAEKLDIQTESRISSGKELITLLEGKKKINKLKARNEYFPASDFEVGDVIYDVSNNTNKFVVEADGKLRNVKTDEIVDPIEGQRFGLSRDAARERHEKAKAAVLGIDPGNALGVILQKFATGARIAWKTSKKDGLSDLMGGDFESYGHFSLGKNAYKSVDAFLESVQEKINGDLPDDIRTTLANAIQLYASPSKMLDALIEGKHRETDIAPNDAAFLDFVNEIKSRHNIDDAVVRGLIEKFGDAVEAEKELNRLEALSYTDEVPNLVDHVLNDYVDETGEVNFSKLYDDLEAGKIKLDPEGIEQIKSYINESGSIEKPQQEGSLRGNSEDAGSREAGAGIATAKEIAEASVIEAINAFPHLSEVEKSTLIRQYKNKVMSEKEVRKYIEANLEKLNAREVDKWGAVILQKFNDGALTKEKAKAIFENAGVEVPYELLESKPLNETAGKRKAEQEWQAELEQINESLDAAKKRLNNKKAELNSKADLFGGEGEKGKLFDQAQDQSPEKLAEIIKPFEDKVTELQQKQQDHLSNFDKYVEEKYKGQQEISMAEEASVRLEVKEKLKAKGLDLTKQLNDIVNPANIKASSKKQAEKVVKNAFAFTDLSKGLSKLQDPLRVLKEKVEDGLTRVFERWVTAENIYVRTASKSVTNWFGGLLRNREDIRAVLSLKGMTREFAPEEGRALHKTLADIVDSDPESLRRVHSALDPELYEAADQTPLNSLNTNERALYDKIREVNDLTHDWNFANGLIDLTTYNKYKDKYIGRLYEEFEIPDDLVNSFERGSNTTSSKLITGIFKAREELNQYKIDNKVSDPAYITAKRMMQTIQNDAVLTYIDYLVKNKPELISQTERPGYTKLDNSRAYGQLKDKWVANHIAEDFKGYFYSNALTNTLYDAFKMYNSSQLVQFYKKYNTLYSPTVQLGNAMGNGVFAFFAGIDPVTFTSKIPEAIKQIRNRGEDYIDLVKNGLIGKTGLTDDFLPLVRNQNRMQAITATDKTLFNIAKDALGKADQLSAEIYQGSDNAAKLAAYLSLKEMGYNSKQAMDRVYDGFQNYATVGKTWDLASKTPVFGNPFVKFQADLQRILKNLIVTRPLQAVAFVSLLNGMASMLSKWSGETEDQKKIREGRKGIPKISLPENLGGDVPLVWRVGGSEVNAARFISPIYAYDVGYTEATLQEASRFLPIQFVNIKQNELGEQATSVAFGDPLGGTIASVMFDRDFRGKSIKNPEANRYFNPSPTKEERLINQFQYIGRSLVPLWKTADDFRRAWNGEEDYYGRQRTWKEAIINNIVKVQSFDDPEIEKAITKEIDYLTKQYVFHTQRMGDANKMALNNVETLKSRLNNGDITQDQYNKLYDRELTTRTERLTEITAKQIEVQKQLEKSIQIYTNVYGVGHIQKEAMKEIISAREKALKLNASTKPIDLRKATTDKPKVPVEQE